MFPHPLYWTHLLQQILVAVLIISNLSTKLPTVLPPPAFSGGSEAAASAGIPPSTGWTVASVDSGQDLQPADAPTAVALATQAAAQGAASATVGSMNHAKSAASLKPTSFAAPQPTTGGYPWHTGILATMFWTGEGATEDNGYISNVPSAWLSDWSAAFGGIDDPHSRCGHNPCAFTPKENPFYFALPFGDYTEAGMKVDLSMVPWYAGRPASGTSILKNRWIEVKSAAGTAVYAQWADVGPFESDDAAYVFGAAAPKYAAAGLDLSPAAANFIALNGRGTVSWRFIDAAQVPAGPWKATVTTSGPNWN